MSKENDKTIEAYEKIGKDYCSIHNRNYDEAAKAYYQHQKDNLIHYTDNLPKTAKIFEVGSASGRDLEILQELGFANITPSDITGYFLQHLKNLGYHPAKFNLLKDDFSEKYDFILCWAVLIHMTKQEAKQAIQKMFDALSGGGRIALSVKLMTHDETKWTEHRHKYGTKRFFAYWKEDEIRNALLDTGFNNVEIKINGSDDSRWVECYAIKPRQTADKIRHAK